MKGFVKIDINDYKRMVLDIEDLNKHIAEYYGKYVDCESKRKELKERLDTLAKSHRDLFNFIDKVGLRKEADAFLEATEDIEDYE